MAGDLESSLLGATLGALLGAISGGLVSFLSERSHDARRRGWLLRDQFDDLSIEFSADVSAYWSSKGPDTALQSRILSGLKRIQVKLSQLGVDLTNDVQARRLIKELFQFSTGGTFASRNHSPDPRRSHEVDRRLELLAEKLPPRP